MAASNTETADIIHRGSLSIRDMNLARSGSSLRIATMADASIVIESGCPLRHTREFHRPRDRKGAAAENMVTRVAEIGCQRAPRLVQSADTMNVHGKLRKLHGKAGFKLAQGQ